MLGLAQAAQDATKKVAGMETLDGRKTAIREKAGETKGEASEMMQTYLGGEEEALDGFEFLTMAEAGELGHWEIVQRISETIGDDQAAKLADWAVEVQRRHFDTVRESSLELAEAEASG